VTAAPDADLAPLGRRAGAWLIDSALGAVLAAGFVHVAGGANDLRTLWHLFAFKSVNGKAGHQLSTALSPTNTQLSALRPVLGLLAVLAVIAVAGVAYRVGTTALWGAGLGKAILGLRIVADRPDRDSCHHGADDPRAHRTEPPSWGRSWARWAVPQGPGLIPLPATGLLAYLPALRDPRRRGLHDRAGGTIVVDVRPRPAPAEATDDYFTPARIAGSPSEPGRPVSTSPR
jgi:uncharacterized RDD family membrane protein YckC